MALYLLNEVTKIPMEVASECTVPKFQNYFS